MLRSFYVYIILILSQIFVIEASNELNQSGKNESCAFSTLIASVHEGFQSEMKFNTVKKDRMQALRPLLFAEVSYGPQNSGQEDVRVKKFSKFSQTFHQGDVIFPYI